MAFSEQALLAGLRRLGEVGRYCVAYSGGLDSSVLLHALVRCRDALGAPLVALHVDHGLLPEAQAWTLHCREVCAALRVPLEVIVVDARSRRAALGTEAAAREARYAALSGRLLPGDCLLTAQHRDDQAETVLLQLVRGGGPAGLAAMPGVAALGRGRLVRPLLGFDRTELRAYADAHAIAYVEDPSNHDPRLARAFLRAEVMPRLQARWPGVNATLARAARHAADAAAIIAERAAEDLDAIATTPWQVSLAALATLSLPRRRAVLRRWCDVRGIPAPDTDRLDETIRQLATAEAGRAPAVTWPGGAFRRYRDALCLTPDLPAHDPRLQLRWDPRALLELPAGLGTLTLAPRGTLARAALEVGVAARLGAGVGGAGVGTGLEAGWEVRFRSPGQRCQPAGRRGHHDLKHLFQEAGVPPWLRDRIPLVLVGGRLASIADRWVCAEFACRDPADGVRVEWRRPGFVEPWLGRPTGR
jgi:tRNA(Ile)-lysidine synthase